MRFAMIRHNGRDGIAVADDGGRLHARFPGGSGYPGNLDALLALGNLEALLAVGRDLLSAPALDPGDVVFLPPIMSPRKVICVGLNYVDHAAESGGRPPPTYPTLFGRFPSSFIGHGAPLIRPHVSNELDFEGELVAVIGKGGRDISKADALDHVIGYSVFNDGSIRDYQMRTPQWTVGKNFDGTGAFGPYFVTADELPPGAKGLKLETRLNADVVQSANTSDMVFDIETLVSLLSLTYTWEPGDLIVSGTPGGVGMARKPPLWMKPGDVCEVEIEKIGLLSNQITQQH